MGRIGHFLILALAASVAGCDGNSDQTNNAVAARPAGGNEVANANAAADAPEPESERVLYLQADGLGGGPLGLHASDSHPFGLSRDEATARVAAVLGRPTGRARNVTCARRPVELVKWGGLTLNFRDDRFAGWTLAGPNPGRPLTTEDDLGIGRRRDSLVDQDRGEARIRQTSRGTEFDALGVRGRLSGQGRDARVIDLYAGQVCFGPMSGVLG